MAVKSVVMSPNNCENLNEVDILARAPGVPVPEAFLIYLTDLIARRPLWEVAVRKDFITDSKSSVCDLVIQEMKEKVRTFCITITMCVVKYIMLL